MDKHICKICNREIDANNHFWRAHGIKEMDYYQKYIPRYSKQTNELIQFKNRNFYLSSDFNDKREMITWIKNNSSTGRLYAMEILYKRIIDKQLKYFPCQVELRSLMMPSLIWYKKTLGTCAEIVNFIKMPDLKLRFDKEDEEIEYRNLSPHDTIIVDTREQLPLKFKDALTKVEKLDYGDYALSPNKYKVHIERKNLSDFVGTFGVGYERFCREVDRAKKDRAYLIILVESTLNDALHFNYLPQTRYCKVGPDFIFHNVRDILQKYNNIQFLFCNGRREAAELVKKIFKIKKHPKHYDLQYYKDVKKI